MICEIFIWKKEYNPLLGKFLFKMESTEPGSVDDPVESNNSETPEEDADRYENCNSEVLSSQNEEDQGGEQVYGYLEVRSSGSEDATIYVDSQGFNLNGQSLIVTQNDDGNEIIVLVSEGANVQPLDQSYAHTSVLHSNEVFEDSMKENEALVVDESPNSLELIGGGQVSPESHVYGENSGEVQNVSAENQDSPSSSADVESPLWSASNNGQAKIDPSEMVFIPTPTVVYPTPEETKHRKLMQLAYIAHELQSADQKCSVSAADKGNKDPELSSELENSVKIAEGDVDNKCSAAPAEEISDKCLPSNDREKYLHFNSKSPNVSSLLSCTSVRTVDNTVSVIHTTSEVQENSLENQAKSYFPSDFSSAKDFQNAESELPSEILYPNISTMSFHNSPDESSVTQQLEACSTNDLEENSSLSVVDDSEERNDAQGSSLALDNDASPVAFIDKPQKLKIDIEDNPLGDADPDTGLDDDSHAGSSILIVEEDESKGHDDDDDVSNISLAKDTDSNQRTCSPKNEVPNEVNSKFHVSDDDDDDDDDDITSNEQCASSSKSELEFFVTKFNFESKTQTQSPERNPILSSVLQDDKAPTSSYQYDFNESSTEQLNSDDDENSKSDLMDFENSRTENLDSKLVIAENVDDEFNEHVSDLIDSHSVKNKLQNVTLKNDFNSKSSQDVAVKDSEKLPSLEKSYKAPDSSVKSLLILDNQSDSTKENNSENNLETTVPVELERKTNDDELSSSEETLVKPPKKTYIRKKLKKSEDKSNSREKIELFSGEDFNFTECDKDINEIQTYVNCDQVKESASSSHENNTESDDLLLLSDVQSKVSATYNRRKKSIPPKQGLRSHSLRPRSLPSNLPLNNGTPEVSDADSKKNSFDSSNSDNIPWGDVLLKTSFQPCNDPNDTPSTSFASQCPKEASTPLLSPEQQRRKLNKYTRDFDRLLNSSPVGSKQHKINKKRIPRMRKKIIRAKQSAFSSPEYNSRIFESSGSVPVHSAGLSRSISGKKTQVRHQKPKEAKIQYFYNEPAKRQSEQATSNNMEMYSCSSCNFKSVYVDNLMEHLKYCNRKQQPVLDYRVNDMDKRQRIRGDDSLSNNVTSTLRKIRNDIRNVLMEEDHTFGFPNQFGEDERDADNLRKRKKYGYGEDDVVWVKFKDRFWPALIIHLEKIKGKKRKKRASEKGRTNVKKVCNMTGLTAHVKLISYPKEAKGLKVKHENIRTFDDSKWNLLCLKEAESLPNNQSFVKAVQSSERFMSKKFLGVRVTGKEFFSVRDEVDFATDSASSDSMCMGNEDSDFDDLHLSTPPARRARYNKLDIMKINEHILGGNANDYVLDIYHKRKHSKKHLTFFEANSSDLKHRPWFGPCDDMKQQEELFRHFRDLFLNKIGNEAFFVSYICQVWIPEAIVQAISVVEGIPLEDAELLFESEDSVDLDEEDPSVEEILKKYT